MKKPNDGRTVQPVTEFQEGSQVAGLAHE
jgi:hypothetical protein